MNVKEAARAAKSYIADIYSDEDISDIGLEEVEIDDFTDTWKITVGFSRPWSQKNNSLVAMLGGDIRAKFIDTQRGMRLDVSCPAISLTRTCSYCLL